MSGEYDAFISYSHADKAVARRVRRAIQTIAKPFWRRRESRVFLDSASLGATSDLGDDLIEALDSSRYLVLLASPMAAQSRWVDQEVAHFVATRGAHNLLIALTDGELRWDDDAGRFDRGASTACPPSLATGLDDEPLYVDLRWLRSDAGADRRRLRSELSAITATIRGVPKDQLVGDDLSQQRRNLAYASGAIVGLIALAIVALLAMLASMANAREARSSLVSTSGALRSQTRPDQGLLLARAGYAVDDTPIAARALYETLVATGPIDRFDDSHQAPVKAMATAGGRLVSGDESGVVLLRDADLDVVADPIDIGVPVQAMIGAGQARAVVVTGVDGSARIIDLGDGSVGPTTQLGPGARAIATDPTLDRLWVGYADGRIIEFGRSGQGFTERGDIEDAGFARVDSLLLTGDRLVIGGSGQTDLDGNRLADGRALAVSVAGRDGGSLPHDRHEIVAPDYVTALADDPARDGVIFATFDGRVMTWEFGAEPRQVTAEAHATLGIAFVAAVDGGDRIVTAGKDGAVTLHDRDSGATLLDTIVHGGPIWAAGVIGDDHVATGSEDRSLALVGFDEPWPAFVTPLYEGAALTTMATTTVWDRETVIIGDGDQLVWLDLEDQYELLRVDRPAAVRAITVGPDGLVASTVATDPPTVELWRADDTEIIGSFSIESSGVAIDLHPDGDLLAVAGVSADETEGIVEFRAIDGTEVHPPIVGLVPSANTLAARFDSQGESLVITGTSTNDAWLSWPDLEPLNDHDPVASRAMAVAVGPDEAIAIATSDPFVQILRLDGADTEIGQLWGAQAVMWSLAFEPAAAMLATGNLDGWVTIWDLDAGAIQIGPPVRAHLGGPVLDLAFTPSGTRLLSLASDQIMVWDLDPDSWAEAACAVSDRSLLASEWDTLVGSGDRPQGSC